MRSAFRLSKNKEMVHNHIITPRVHAQEKVTQSVCMSVVVVGTKIATLGDLAT